MILSRYNLKNISKDEVTVPGEAIFDLPEKVLQFGTGVLLRGLPDYFIDKANRQGIFNGRVVVVKSTSYGDTSAFDKQDGLYTVCVRGIENGQKVEKNIINSSISRVLTATEQWGQILECAHNPFMQIIISNTTEVGIQLVKEDIRKNPPASFPGKLLSFLYERFTAFGGSQSSGMIIIPTELLPGNGKKLESILLELAHLNSLDEAFIEWLEKYNHFCNSLVDRIVPGKPEEAILNDLEKSLGYTDHLLTNAEVYRLWAIEGDEKIKNILSFAQVDEGVVITPDIDRYRELKLRVLNGTHTLSCGVAFLANINTVKEAMDDDIISSYIENLMMNEVAPAIPYPIDLSEARAFGEKVLDRFRNPHIKHQWINITVQYSSKMKMRNVPILLKHYSDNNTPPPLLSLGFAAYLVFMKGTKIKEGKVYGEWNGIEYHIQDDMAEVFYNKWQAYNGAALVSNVLSDSAFWGEDLSNLPMFAELVTAKMDLILTEGMKNAVAATKNEFAKYEL